MTVQSASLYRGFILVAYTDGSVAAFRTKDWYDRGIRTYTGVSYLDVQRHIDKEDDFGFASQEEVDEIHATSFKAEPVTPKYPLYIMRNVRQKLGLDNPDDTSKDQEINEMSHIAVFTYCLEWEGMIGYSHQIVNWVEAIYGVELR